MTCIRLVSQKYSNDVYKYIYLHIYIFSLRNIPRKSSKHCHFTNQIAFTHGLLVYLQRQYNLTGHLVRSQGCTCNPTGLPMHSQWCTLTQTTNQDAPLNLSPPRVLLYHISYKRQHGSAVCSTLLCFNPLETMNQNVALKKLNSKQAPGISWFNFFMIIPPKKQRCTRQNVTTWIIFVFCCYAATQLALQVQQEFTQSGQ